MESILFAQTLSDESQLMVADVIARQMECIKDVQCLEDVHCIKDDQLSDLELASLHSLQSESDQLPADYVDDFVEDLSDPECVQRIYDFSVRQVRTMVDYNDVEDVVQEVFYRLHKWPIGGRAGTEKKYNSARHYFSLLKITIRQAVAAYWKRRHSQRNDVRRRAFFSQLDQRGARGVEFVGDSNEPWRLVHLKELVASVLEKAKTLSHEQRVMFQMRFLDEKSHEEIAEVLGVSIRSSYRLETKVRKTLQCYFSGWA